MPYANNNGVKIYYEVEGQGPPLILVHGATRSGSFWRESGYSNALKGDYRLVMMDVRGHGRSDKPHDPSAYGSAMASDVIAVLDDAKINKAHYYGYSLGGGLGFWLATSDHDRFHSFILGGINPYPTSEAQVKENEAAMARAKLQIEDPDAFLLTLEQNVLRRPLTADERRSALAVDGHAMLALMTASKTRTTYSNSDLSRIRVPCLLYCGDLDPSFERARESTNHIPSAEFVSLPGLAHGPAMMRSDLVLPHVKEFLAKAGKT